MAEAIGFASAIAGLATFGIQIVTTLNKFATTYSQAEQQVNDLSASVALTTSILESIGKEIKEHEDQLHVTVDHYLAVSDMCKKNFDALWVALKVVKKGKDEKSHAKVELGVWAKMSHALGGADALKDLVISIETSKSNLQLLLTSLQFSVLKSLKKSNLLTEDQSDDLKLFTSQIPFLFVALHRAGFIGAELGKKKPIENAETNAVNSKMPDGNVALPASEPGLSSDNNSSGNDHISPPNLDKAVMQEATVAPTQAVGTSPTEIQFHAPSPRPPPAPPGFSGYGNDIAVIKERDNGETIQSGKLETSFFDTESIYEGWVIQSKPPKDPSPAVVIGFCGMRLKAYRYPQTKSTIDYVAIPFSKDKGMLKNRASSSKTKVKPAPVEEHKDKNMVKDLPTKARREVLKLVDDRNRRSRPLHRCKIAAVTEHTRKSNFWSAPWKSRSPTSWLVIIRGAIIEPDLGMRRKRNIALPRRRDDPWRQGPVSQTSSESDSEDSSTSGTASSSGYSESLRYTPRYRRAARKDGHDVALPRKESGTGYILHPQMSMPISMPMPQAHLPIQREFSDAEMAEMSNDRTAVTVNDEEEEIIIDAVPSSLTNKDAEVEIVDDEEMERLMDQYLASFTKDDGKETEEEKREETLSELPDIGSKG